MNCPNCAAAIPNQSDKFCSSCGARLDSSAPTSSVTNLSVSQDVSDAATGATVTGVEVEQVHGDVHIEAGQVVLQSSEAGNLKLIDSISTEVRAGTAAGLEGSKIPTQLGEANGKLDSLLKMMREQDRRGKSAHGVEVGGTQISRVNLLLKKATLLKIQSEQMMLDQVEKAKGRVNMASGQIDLNEMFVGFDSDAHDAKLNEAKELLEEARKLDPTNTEVLLHLAELLTQVTEDDPTDERRVLYEVQSLLRNPKDDAERFRLAQATFLLATSHEPTQVDSLKDARDMFDRLGRADWTRHCDDLLRSAGAGGGQTLGSTQPAPSPSRQFQPVGDWNVRIMDAVGSTMTLSIAPNGMFAATQLVPVTGMTMQANGQWAFNPMNSLLQLQGTIGGWQPFMLGIFVQGWQGDAFYGVGTDGIAYALSQT